MGGLPQMIDLLAIALAILAFLLLSAFLVGTLFQNKKTRKRILWGALTIYALAFVAYFGFIAFVLSGNPN
jgi:VIT1/CCC1 family predicted Fe2+/Mn2+ transporter